MKKYYVFITLLAVGIMLVSFTDSPDSDSPVPYPEGYRKWTHVKSNIVKPASPSFPLIGGYNHVYANEKAMEGYTTGNFPNGSVIVFDVLDAVDDSLQTSEGKRRRIDVMLRDTDKYHDADGWTFEQFSEGSDLKRMMTPVKLTACKNCHAKSKDYVFSDFRK